MPNNYDRHQRAAEFHDNAAAAHSHDKQDHLTGSELSRNALEHSQKAHFQSEQAHRNHSVMLLNGKHSGRFEVGDVKFLDDVFTSSKLERTLVEMTVRPVYAGGVAQVIEAFSRARETASTMKLLAVLKRLDYVYPYHQSVGFYMERAGFKPAQYEKLRELGLEFYLSYDMRETGYDSGWRIFSPKGL